jgi:hypothetical protein
LKCDLHDIVELVPKNVTTNDIPNN